MGYDMNQVSPSQEDVEYYQKRRAEYEIAMSCIKFLRKTHPNENFSVDFDDNEWMTTLPAAAVTIEALAPILEGVWDDPTYYRLNIWGMGMMREVMESLGMVHNAPHPSFPEYPGEEHFDPEGDPIDDVGRTYETASEEVTHFTSQIPGIPVGKFGSNDGWRVTPAECASAVEIYNAYTETEIEAALASHISEHNSAESLAGWLQRWVDWLERCVKTDGFAVH
jgi:hypothetical protein